MTARERDAIIRTPQREVGIWVGVAVAMLAATFVALRTWNTMGQFALVWIAGSAVGFVVAGYQSYRNGSVALTWLILAAPFVSVWVERYLRVGGLPAGWPLELLSHSVAIVFLGTTAFLVGLQVAKTRGVAPRALSESERRALIAVLLLSGVLFASTFVLSLW